MSHRKPASQTILESRLAFGRSLSRENVDQRLIQRLESHLEYIMDLYGNVLSATLTVIGNQQATIAGLQTQLATAQANALPSDTLAVVQTAENNPLVAAVLNASSGSPANTSGGALNIPSGSTALNAPGGSPVLADPSAPPATLTAGTGTDTVVSSTGTDTVAGSAGADTVPAGAAPAA